MPELLLELFSEEIPARMQAKASADLARMITAHLKGAGLGHGPARAYATPRRLTLVVDTVADATDAVREEMKGPKVGAPEKALQGFLRKTGLSEDQLEKRPETDKKGQVKGEVWFAVIEKPARPADAVIAEAALETIAAFPWPKSMRWGEGELRWVRPLRSILCLLSDGETARVVPFEIAGIASGAVTYGHRFLAVDKKTGAPKPLQVEGFQDYAAQLKKAKVLLDAEERKKKIRKDAGALAKAEGLELVEDDGLLAEVAGLVEHPVALMGAIEPRFQALPAEVLRTSMKEHQKFFSLRDPKSGAITRFVTVANIAAKDGGAKILAGNERVLRARLADAEFFYQNDLARPLAESVDKLAAVTFHNQLGSQADRVTRIRALARALAPLVDADADLADRAALLAKADLCTEMVYEFPELQGFMGRVYAEAGGEPAAVAAAIEDHYAPAGAGDAVPTEPVAIAVALADKLDQLAAFWTIGAKPTGSGDPFALRRAALGVIRIILENGLRLRLGRALAGHAEQVNAHAAATARRGAETIAEGTPTSEPMEAARARMAEEGYGEDRIVIERRLFGAAEQADLLAFFADRLKVALRDHGVRHDVVDAVFNLARRGETADWSQLDDLVRTQKRIDALAGLMGSEDGANLLAAFKRANNILTAEEAKDGVEYSLDPEPGLAEAGAEKALFKALDQADETVKPALSAEDYPAAMAAMAKLRPVLDRFFDEVVVNADAATVRRNRLCLLNRIRRTLGVVADFSALTA